MAPAEVREDVAQRVVENVSHVQVAGRIGQHLEHVEFLTLLAGPRIVRVEGARVLPDPLPLRLDRLWVVRLHVCLRIQKDLSLREAIGESARPWPRSSPALLEKLLHPLGL